MEKNPCVSCGACCAHFRVQFYWREANPADTDNAVPGHLFEELTPQHRCMKGTAKKHHPKCEGLKGGLAKMRVAQFICIDRLRAEPLPRVMPTVFDMNAVTKREPRTDCRRFA